jgi:hypothetical protein
MIPGATLSRTTDVTAAQLKALATVGISLLPAPGAGRANVPLALFVQVAFGTAAFTDPGGTADLAIASSTDPAASAWIYWEFLNAAYAPPSPAVALFLQTTDAYWIGAAPALNTPFTESAPPAFANTPLGLVNYGANLAAGDGSARFTVYYAVADLA